MLGLAVKKLKEKKDFLRGMVVGANLFLVAFVGLGGDLLSPFERGGSRVSFSVPGTKDLGTEATSRISHALGRFAEAFILIESEHVDAQLDDPVIDVMLDRALESLDDYSGYLDTASAQRATQAPGQSRDRMLGVLVVPVDGAAVVEAVYPESPAQNAGMEPGDRIVEIAGTSVEGRDIEEVMDILRHAIAQSGQDALDVGVVSPGGTQNVTRTMRPGVIEKIGVFDLGVRDGVLHVAIDRFYRGMAQDVIEVIEARRRESEIVGIVLDLRNNGGGLTSEARLLAEFFLPAKSLIYHLDGRDGVAEEIMTDREALYPDMGLSVLVNARSASASEIFAGAIQAHGRGTVVGWRTYGKGSVQRIYALERGAIKITSAAYLDAGMRVINGIGIAPDIEIDIEDPGVRVSRFLEDPARKVARIAARGGRS